MIQFQTDAAILRTWWRRAQWIPLQNNAVFTLEFKLVFSYQSTSCLKNVESWRTSHFHVLSSNCQAIVNLMFAANTGTPAKGRTPPTRHEKVSVQNFWMHNTTCTTQSLLNVSRFLFHDFHAISLYLQHNPHLESLTIVDYRWLSLPIAECRSPVIYQGCAGTCRGIWFVRTGSEIGAWRLVEILDEIWWDMQCKKCSETVTAMSKPWDAMDSIG